MTRRFLAGGVIAGPLFVATFLIEGATRAHYDPLRHPVSSLELGDFGWIQSVNFVVAGLLTLGFAIGLRRVLRPGGTHSPASLQISRPVRGSTRGSTWGPLLIGIWAIHLIFAGVFVTDPVSGYPPGTPDLLTEFGSAHAAVHDLVSIPGFLSLAAAPFVLSRRFAAYGARAWSRYSILTGIAFVTAFVLATVGFNQVDGLVDIAGLLQRVTAVIGWCWLTLLAAHHLRTLRKPRTGA
ncbi:hypothetical protein Aph01nite_62970 [Acrocarpospora phusangensis]|uniref:DUF998 domain-containing protein n=2 Tax=Acrocarpospora phusangensis TaxID=1070424 RepID=A0A919QKS5_9ACTN|nr:hypothetical protein Aph01nite_62970 [Acrocarpospora phusangensis]